MSDDNFTKFPNAVLEAAFLSDLSTLEYVALLYVARKTYGWGKASDTISIRKMAADTGHDIRAMQRAVASLQERKILTVTPRGPRKTNSVCIGDPAHWDRHPEKKGRRSKHTVTQPYTATEPYTVTRPGVYGHSTVCSDGHSTVYSDGHSTTHKRNKTNKETITKESAPPAPEGANVATDAADVNATAADTANANTNANASDWTPSELPDDVWADASLWK